MFVLSNDRNEIIDTLKIQMDPEKPFAPPAHGLATHTLEFDLRALRGHDARIVSDATLRNTKGGGQEILAGTVSRAKAVRSVVAIRGLAGSGGEPITKLTDEIYDALPAWITNKIVYKVNALAAEFEDDLGN